MLLELDDLRTILAGGMPGRPLEARDAPATDEPDEEEDEEKD